MEKIKALYRLYDQALQNPVFKAGDMVCRPGCSDCCTCNVAVTSLEAAFLVQSLRHEGVATLQKRLMENFPAKRYQPALTFNGFAAACIQGREAPEEENDPEWGQCPLLEDGLCTVYETRPFGCRGMMSKISCGKSGYADMPEVLLTLNNLFCQYIEQLDPNGWYGNLSDMLARALGSELGLELGQERPDLQAPVKNMKIPVLMVPPEHRQIVMPIISRMPVPD